MISFDVKNRWSGKIKFTAEIDCKEEESKNIKLGLAVKWAIRNNADLSSADLRYADLRYADLRYANLSYADLRYADLSSADLHYANLSSADLHYANLRSAKNAIIPITIGQCGNDIRTGYAIWDDIEKKVFVRLGCFYGEEKKAIDAVSKKYGSRSGYLMMVRAACKIAKERKVLNPTKETKK